MSLLFILIRYFFVRIICPIFGCSLFPFYVKWAQSFSSGSVYYANKKNKYGTTFRNLFIVIQFKTKVKLLVQSCLRAPLIIKLVLLLKLSKVIYFSILACFQCETNIPQSSLSRIFGIDRSFLNTESIFFLL